MIAEATTNLYPQVVNWDEKYGSFDKDGNKVEIDESKIAEEVKRLQAEFDAKQYQRDRKYPELGEQFDLLFKDIDSGKVSKDGGFYKAIKAVKDKHPKPSE